MPFCTPIIFQYTILKNNGGGFAAANKDLRKAVDEGKLRSNLYYRLNVLSVSIPSLRERRDDIRPLAEYFLERYCHRYGIDKTFDDNVFRQLEQYPWPGKLKHLVERAILTRDLTTVHSIFLPNQATTPATEEPAPPSRVTETALLPPEPSVDWP